MTYHLLRHKEVPRVWIGVEEAMLQELTHGALLQEHAWGDCHCEASTRETATYANSLWRPWLKELECLDSWGLPLLSIHGNKTSLQSRQVTGLSSTSSNIISMTINTIAIVPATFPIRHLLTRMVRTTTTIIPMP